MPTWRHLALVALVAAVLTPGCGFHRTKINERVRDIDVSNIVPGETTWQEVLLDIGAPSAIEALDFITTGGLSRRNLNYTYAEHKRVSFVFLPLWLIFPSVWQDNQHHRRILVELSGDQDEVLSVTVTSRKSVWPMWGDMTNDEPLSVDYDDGSGS